jgi:glycogen(starch) synthase
VHPEVHAHGELRSLWRERAISRETETARMRATAAAVLTVRTALQRFDARVATGFISPSSVFASDLVRDLGASPHRIRVVPNPIDMERFSEGAAAPREGPVRLVFVGRTAVRKGVEMIVALSHRLADLAGQVDLEVIGGPSLWSDYRGLLRELNPSVARYSGGEVPPEDLVARLRSGDVLLQPSHYEPFALTVGEGLACGMVAVTSDRVGASEEVDRAVALRFPAGDLDAFEAQVRHAIGRVRSTDGESLRATARSEAQRLFSPDKVGAEAVAALRELVSVKTR